MRVALTLLILLLSVPSTAAELFNAGFRTLGIWTEASGLRLNLNVWYPAQRSERELNFTPWIISGALNARAADGKFPLIIISHATPASRFSYHELAASLARNGFIVAAPTHTCDNLDNMEDLFTWNQLKRRTEEISAAINAILEDKQLKESADPARIGFMGAGAGAAAGLLLGGALPTCASLVDFCGNAAANPYCGPLNKNKIFQVCNNFPLKKSLADPRIKVMVLLSPGYAMFFDSASFKYFYPPVLLVAAGKDKFNPPSLHCELLGRILGKKARYLDFQDADAPAMTSACPPNLAKELPDLCSSVTSAERLKIRNALTSALLSFYGWYLLDPAHLPSIPAPPNLTSTKDADAKTQNSAPAKQKRRLNRKRQ